MAKVKVFKKELLPALRMALNAIFQEYSVELDAVGQIFINGTNVHLNVRYDGGVYRVLNDGKELCCGVTPQSVKSFVITHFVLRREVERCPA